MTLDEALDILVMQEDILQFSHFTNEDAWELGKAIVEAGKRLDLPLAVRITRNGGQQVFAYAANQMELINQISMEKKERVCQLSGMSSLHFFMDLERKEMKAEDMGFDRSHYHAKGGSFPIRVEEVGMVAAVTISGFDHVLEHDFLIKSISQYLHIDEVPRIRG